MFCYYPLRDYIKRDPFGAENFTCALGVLKELFFAFINLLFNLGLK